jgi:hypothetical protein
VKKSGGLFRKRTAGQDWHEESAHEGIAKCRADEVPAMAHRRSDCLGRRSLQPEEKAGGQPPKSKHQGGAKVPHSKIR